MVNSLRSFAFIRFVALKEIREIIRDGRLRLLGIIVVVLAIAALAFGVQQTSRAQHDREHAAERATDQWQDQGDKNPHVAAHYGTHAFAPTSVATALDPGVSDYLGRAIKLEAHKRNLAAHSAAQDGAGLQRLGSFSVSTVLLQLVPLLIVALGYGLWSRERERGTLRQVLSTGVNRSSLFWGKALALFVVVGALLIPAAIVIIVALWWLGGGDASTVVRLGLLGVSYALYFAIFGGLTLFASAIAGSSRAALVGMIGIWGVFCLIAPRGATEVASALVPLPSQAQLARDVAKTLNTGVDGTVDREEAVGKIVAELMKDQGFAESEMLVDEAFLAGIELQAEARWEDQAFDHHVLALDDRIAAQERMVSWAGFISPFVAMRGLSAGLSGTDFAHHRHFTDYAEQWRKELVGSLNTAFADQAGADGWEYKAGADLWKKTPPFAYISPAPSFALREHLISIAALFFWLIIAIGAALRSAARVKAV
ncbi:MAG: ABC-2 type transport system permease protein [Myxococcota bacterium]|jgi:ABC-2 type transport system permease protein